MAKKKSMEQKLKEAEKKARSVGVFEDGEDLKELLNLEKKTKKKIKRVAKKKGGMVKTKSDFTFTY